MNTPFEQWYNGMVGFHINSERILDDLDMFGANAVDPVRLRKWMVVCWNNAIDACVSDSDYLNFDVEKLKEPLDKTL